MSRTRESYNKYERKRIIYEQEYSTPEPPPFEQIDGHDKPLAEQMFHRTPFPKDFEDWPVSEQNKFIDNEWNKIDNGYWFFNNGKLVYLTGVHYFYINWWLIMITEEGKPKTLANPRFVDSDLNFFYHWDKCEKSKDIAGLIYITNRRDGKSYKFGCIIYLRCIQYKNSHHGIQSKSEDDAQGFLGKIIDAWRELPWIFKPMDNGITNPKKSLDFSEPSRRVVKNVNQAKRSTSDYHNSHIHYKSTKETAYDGSNLLTYVNDESGKNTESDVHKTLQIVLETMVAGSYITGKCGVTSTVEEMEKGGGANLKKIWDESDPKKLSHIGRTQNKCIRYFKPAYYGMEGVDANGVSFINKYGETDWRRAKAFLEKERENLSGETLAQYIRMYPFTVDEAFNSVNACAFNDKHIRDQINYNDIYVDSNNLQRGNFRWRTNAIDGIVDWKPDPEGRFLASWFPDVKDRNKWHTVMTEKGMQRSPMLNDIVGGVDPYSHDDTSDGRNSNAGFHLFRKKTIWDDSSRNPHAGTFVLEYIYRQPSVIEFYEDVLLASVFYSARILFENQKPNINDHFINFGYYDFLMKRPQDFHTDWSRRNKTTVRGIATNSPFVRKKMIDRLESYIEHNMGRDELNELKVFLPFNRTLKDWKNFNPNKWTDYDATVSSMLALVASDVEIKIKSQEPEYSKPIIPIWDNSGETPILLN